VTDSFEQRIVLAENEREKAIMERDRYYPGTTAWEQRHVAVVQWERTILDLREQSGL
jgi:hypothetical protein